MSAHIIGYGTALPPFSIDWKESAEYAQVFSGAAEDSEARRRIPAVYRMSGVKQRHCTVLSRPAGVQPRQDFFPPPVNGNSNGPDITRRMERYEADAPRLAEEASTKALADAGADAAEVTHIVTVSCSGFMAPGVDIHLMKTLGLSPTVQRVHVGFMGCHGALNGIRAARGIAESQPEAVVLLCAVELCSLHYHYGHDTEQLIANALFADGAAALVIAGGSVSRPEKVAWRIQDTASCLIPNSEDAMSWRVRTHGFVMTLSREVPALIQQHLRPWTDAWLKNHGLTVKDIASYAVHPGGPKILDSVAQALSLEDGALRISRGILSDFGNMSSPTILFILKALRESGADAPCLALAFGPGLAAEGVLFTAD